jgi:hypothetical protein
VPRDVRGRREQQVPDGDREEVVRAEHELAAVEPRDEPGDGDHRDAEPEHGPHPVGDRHELCGRAAR